MDEIKRTNIIFKPEAAEPAALGIPDVLPWPEEFPYHPRVLLSGFWNPDCLNLDFHVQEKTVRSAETNHQLVSRDSCVEFFFRLPRERDYYNLEVNPSGLFLFSKGPDRRNRTDLTESVRDFIGIEGLLVNLGRFDERDDIKEWSLSLNISPEAVDGVDAWGPNLTGVTANIYKCGDSLSEPHYLAWFLPLTEKPDFHRPEYFGPLEFVGA